MINSMTKEIKEQLINYFKYVCINRKKKSILKYSSILILCFIFFFYTLVINRDLKSLTPLQMLLYTIIVIFFGYLAISELLEIKKVYYYLTNKGIQENIEIELGKIKHVNTDRVACRVTVTDAIGDVYIANYAPELLSEIYTEIDAYIIYLKNKKDEFIAAYPVLKSD